MYQFTSKLYNTHSLDVTFFNGTIQGHHQIDEIFDTIILQGQFRIVKLNFRGIYPKNRPLLKPVIFNCHRLFVQINKSKINSYKKIFGDLLEWFQIGGVFGETKQLCLEYCSSNCIPLLDFLKELRQVFSSN